MSYYKQHIFLCTNQKKPGKVCCAQTGGMPFFDYFKKKLKQLNLLGEGKTKISQSGCLGRCSRGPCLVIYPEGIWYQYHTFDDLDDILNCHLIEGQLVSRLLITSSR